MRVMWVVALLVLAGCADDGSSQETDDFEDAFEEDVEVTSTTGAIRGVVVDEAIVPIAGAMVNLKGTERSKETGEQGTFVFNDLDPGSYFLEVTKPGYKKIQSAAQVEAGVENPPIVRIQLTSDPGSLPIVIPLDWNGFLGCSMRTPALGLSCPGADTIWPEHDFLVDYELDGPPDWVVSEMQWESTQPLGGEMSFNIRRDDTNRDTTDVEGTSPLSLTVDRAMAEGAGFGVDSPLRVIVFTAHIKETEPPGGVLWGVGLQIEQSFDVYTHIFYNTLPHPEWRFLTDGPP